MSVALQKILGHTPLTEALRTKSSGIPKVIPDEFFSVSDSNRILGDRARYIRISGERRLMMRGKYGAPARRRSLRDIGDQSVRMLHNFEGFAIDFMVLQQLRSFEKYEQDKGLEWLSYQLDEAAQRQVNTEVIAVASMLRHGALYWDSNGTMLASSSGADSNYTISASIPATHQNQCNGIIDASWALANTDIPGHINALQQFSLQETGMELGACLYGLNVSKYIRQNAYCQAYLSRNPGMNDKMVAGTEIPDGLFGMKWIPVWKTFFESDDDGTIAEIWNDDLAVFVPNVDQPDKMRWWAMYEGSMPVPRSLEVQRDPMAAFNTAETVYGKGGYAVPTVNPPSFEVYNFHTFLPMIRNEKAIFQATVAF